MIVLFFGRVHLWSYKNRFLEKVENDKNIILEKVENDKNRIL
jgi:hypothetical protein